MIVFASLKIYQYIFLTSSKSIPQKSNHDYKEKYPYISICSLETKRIKDILTINRYFRRTPDKDIKMIIGVETSLHSLTPY